MDCGAGVTQCFFGGEGNCWFWLVTLSDGVQNARRSGDEKRHVININSLSSQHGSWKTS